MRVRLSKIIETATIRFHLQCVVEMPVMPQAGWFLAGYTTNAAIELVVDRVGWDCISNRVECVLTEKKIVEIDDDTARDWIEKSYGRLWKITSIHLTMDGPSARCERIG